MKTLLVLSCLFALGGNLTAQFAVSKGVGATISFTNSRGEEIKDATVTAIAQGELIWKARRTDGTAIGGRVKLSELPEDLARDFGYDPKRAAEINAANAAKNAAQQNALAAERRVEMWRANQAAATKMVVVGRVTQVTSDGMLVSAEMQMPKQTSTFVNPTGRNVTPYTIVRTGPPSEDGSPLFVGRCLITDADTAGWTDDSKVRAVVYPNGTYTYESVGAGTRTIQKFTLNPAKVTTPATPENFESLKKTYRFNTPSETRQ